MPCFTRITYEKEIELTSREMVEAMLAKHKTYTVQSSVTGIQFVSPDGLTGFWDAKTGKLTVSAYSSELADKTAGELRKEYAEEAVKVAAKRFGWAVKQTGDTITLNRR